MWDRDHTSVTMKYRRGITYERTRWASLATAAAVVGLIHPRLGTVVWRKSIG